MNNCKINKFVHTKYKKKMTITDIDMIMHKKSKNHIRIVESKHPTERYNSTQDDALREIARVFKFAMDRGYPMKLEVLKLIGDPNYITEVQHPTRLGEMQEVYDLKQFQTKDFITGEVKYYNTQKDIDTFFLMDDKEQDKYNEKYKSYYPQQMKINF
jgi:hypothetical protein